MKLPVNASNPGVKLLNGAVHCIEIMNVYDGAEKVAIPAVEAKPRGKKCR